MTERSEAESPTAGHLATRRAPVTAAIETSDLTRSFPSGVALDGLTLVREPG